MGILDMSKLPAEPDPVYVKSRIGTNLDYLKEVLDKPEEEIYNAIKQCIEALLTQNTIKGRKELLRVLFTNNRFLLQMGSYCSRNKITHEQRVCLNKIMYSMIKNNAVKSEYQSSNLMMIARAINNDIVPRLTQIVPDQIACSIAILRYSSFKEVTNVLRVNEFLLGAINPNDKTEQTIVNIYDILFQKVTFLFEGTMIGIKDKSLLSDNEREVYGYEALAVLDILEQMPMDFIEQILDSYYSDLSMVYAHITPRFSLLSIAQSDYPRIIAADQKLSAGRRYRSV